MSRTTNLRRVRRPGESRVRGPATGDRAGPGHAAGRAARSTLPDWIQQCPRCRAAAPDLSALPPAAKAIVESDAYRALSASGLEETLPFRRWALICERTGDRPQQAEALLQAAWAADDAAVMTDAARLRTEVAALWDGTRMSNSACGGWMCCAGPGCSTRRPPGRSCWRPASRRKPRG